MKSNTISTIKSSSIHHTPSADRTRQSNTATWDIQKIESSFDLSAVTEKRPVYVVPYTVEPAPRFLLATKVNTAYWFSSGFLREGGIEATWGSKRYFVYPKGLQYQVNKNGGEIVLIGGCEQHKTVLERAYAEFAEETGVDLEARESEIIEKNVFQYSHQSSGTFYVVYLKFEDHHLAQLSHAANKNLTSAVDSHFAAAVAGEATLPTEPAVRDNELQSVAIYQAERFHCGIFHLRYGDYFKVALDHFKSTYVPSKPRPTPATPSTPAPSAAPASEEPATPTAAAVPPPAPTPEEIDGWTTVVAPTKTKSTTKPSTSTTTTQNKTYNNVASAAAPAAGAVKPPAQENNRWKK
jgi:8-oxo-dGTP pyrophosphatase MutT (NUDIX family)